MNLTAHPLARPIADAVCRKLGVSMSEVLGAGRHPRICTSRDAIVGLCKERTNLSLPEIARAMGRKNHSAAWHQHHCWLDRWTEDQRVEMRAAVDSPDDIVVTSETPVATWRKGMPGHWPLIRKPAEPKPAKPAKFVRERTEEERMFQRWRPIMPALGPKPYEPKPVPLHIPPLPDEPAARLHGGWNRRLDGKESPRA